MYLAYQYIDFTVIFITLLFLVLAMWTDLKDKKIKDIHVLSFFIVRMILMIWVPLNTDNIIGLVVGFSIFFVPAMIKNVPMGGDIKTYALLGFLLGWRVLIPHLMMTMIISLLTFGFISIKQIKNKQPVNLKQETIPMAGIFLLAFIIVITVSMLGLPCPCGLLLERYV